MSLDPNDPRVKQLIQSLMQQGHGGGKPVFGGGPRNAGGGGGQRGSANYFRPGFSGINYNPLAAQMAQGAPGLLGLQSGGDSNAVSAHSVDSVTPDQVNPVGDVGMAPPVEAGPAPSVGQGPIVPGSPVDPRPPAPAGAQYIDGPQVATPTGSAPAGSGFLQSQMGGFDGDARNRAAYYASRRIGGGRY